MLKNWKTLKPEGNKINWRAVDEIILTSFEHVPALVLDGASISLYEFRNHYRMIRAFRLKARFQINIAIL